MKDIAGQRFGRLVAIEPTPERSRGLVKWRCRCDCGNEVEVVSSSLLKGNTRSCGCLKNDTVRSDLSGRRFGKLTAIEPTDKRVNGLVVWRCACDCGNECEATSNTLLRGRKKSCGCGSRELVPTTFKDLTGQRFGRLVAVEPTDRRLRGSVVWRCRCDCGNVCEASSNMLMTGHKKSCGCLRGGEGGHSAYRDLSGQRFGRLVAIRPDGRKYRCVLWECRCDCGNTTHVASNMLTSGKTKSCGCLRKVKSV